MSSSAAVAHHRASVHGRRRQGSLDSGRVISVYDNVVTSPAVSVTSAKAVNDDPQRQLDVILSALYRDIGMLSSSLAVVSEERNGICHLYLQYCKPK